MLDCSAPRGYASVLEELRRRLSEPPNYLVQLLVGPRQVGKTTLLLELEKLWPETAMYHAADAPAAALPGWWENLWTRAERLSQKRPVLLLLDEVHYLPNWSRMLKSRIDDVRRRELDIRIVATGSSALSVGRGARETMAGRLERLKLLHWQAADISERFGIEPTTAARNVVRFGGYPGAVPFQSDLRRYQAYVRESIIEPAIGRDILAVQDVRRPALLRQVFALAAGHPAEIVSLRKTMGQLQDAGALETISHYHHLLEEAFLVAAVAKYSGRTMRQRASPPKMVALNNALLCGSTHLSPPSAEENPTRWGRWVENACIAFAWNCGQAVYYWREEPFEVDLVLTGSWGKWAIEIKTGRLTARAPSGVLEFVRRHSDFRPALVCDPGEEHSGAAAGITAITWPSFLLRGLPS